MSKCRTPNTPRAGSNRLPLPSRSRCRLPAAVAATRWLATAVILSAGLAPAQEALRYSLAGDAAAEAQNLKQTSQAYTIKSGDFRLLATPSFTVDWNSNINDAHTGALQDFILWPTLGLDMSYPVTEQNVLRLNGTFGYQEYLEHSDYSRWSAQSGSALSYDIYVKDFWFNLHDLMSCLENSSQQAAVANTGLFGDFQNTAGVNTTWDLEDVTLSLGLDYQTYLATSAQFDYTDRSTELIVARGGFKFYPTLTAGLEATVAPTTYDQHILNNNVNYSTGVYADWHPGTSLNVQPRVGYTYFQFDQTSGAVPAVNQGAWYFDLTIRHELTQAVSYSLSAGHEITLGIYGDTIEDWYALTSITWSIFKNLSLTPSLSYKNGSQGIANTTGAASTTGTHTLTATPEENFSWFTGTLGLRYPFTKRFTLALNYQLTLRASNYTAREYAQNLVGVQLTYSMQ
jgi:hypothetical protein